MIKLIYPGFTGVELGVNFVDGEGYAEEAPSAELLATFGIGVEYDAVAPEVAFTEATEVVHVTAEEATATSDEPTTEAPEATEADAEPAKTSKRSK